MAGELTDDEQWVVGELLARGWLPIAEIERRRATASPGRLLPALAVGLAPAQLDELRRGLVARRTAPVAGGAPVAPEEAERTVVLDLPGVTSASTPACVAPASTPAGVAPAATPAGVAPASTVALPPTPVSTLSRPKTPTVPTPRPAPSEELGAQDAVATLAGGAPAAAPGPVAAPAPAPRAWAPGANPWKPGLRVGDLVLKEKLGRGAMGAVFLAVNEATSERFAVKVLPADEAGEKEVERFRREALAMSAADHPNVVRVHSHGEAHGCHYLVLELLEGGDLDKRLERQGPLPLLEALKMAVQLARGLTHAHTRGVLHRDLKPANVMFDAQGRAKLVDFGIARVEGQRSLTATGSVMGSPAFMPPEQAMGVKRAVDERSDVYGLGAILYTALCGCIPHDGATTANVLTAVLTQPLVAPSRRRRGTSSAADELVLKAMAKEPDQRFPSARALTDALDALIAEVEAQKGRGRGRAVVGVVVAVTALATGAGGLALGAALSGRGDPPAPVASAVAPATERAPAPPPARGAPGTDPKGLRGPRTLRAGMTLVTDRPDDRTNLFRWRPPARPETTFLLRWIPPTPSAGFKLGARNPLFAGQPGVTEEVRVVSLPGFFLGSTEVTRGQWAAITRAEAPGTTCMDVDRTVVEPTPDHPATGVSWEAARDFCVAAGGRLPSEAEWEWAARGAEARVYPWGDEFGAGRANLREPGIGLAPVGSFQKGRSAFGCDDLAGNACEWTADTWVQFTLLEALGVRERCITDDVVRAIPEEAYVRANIIDRPRPGDHVHRGGDYRDVEDEGWTLARAHKGGAFSTAGLRLVVDE